MDAKDAADQFFSLQSLATVSGCGIFVWTIVNGLRVFTGFAPKWLFLAVSAILMVTLFFTTAEKQGAGEILAMVGNIFVVAFAALGLQEGAVQGVAPPVRTEEHAATARTWFSSWLA